MNCVRDLLIRDPDRPIETVIKITDHEPQRVWVEMDEYVPTETIVSHYREILEALRETRTGHTERVCIWISGFFGSGKSHFLKALGFLLQDKPLRDPGGGEISSQEFLCRKVGLADSYLPILQKEFRPRVLFINLLDYDASQQPTLSRLIFRTILEQKGLSTIFWVAAWEQELQRLGLWERFLQWVQTTYQRPWQEERALHAETILQKALPALLPERYSDESSAKSAIDQSKEKWKEITPSQVAQELRKYAEEEDSDKGRTVVLLDEVGLYIGDKMERLTDLKSLAEQIVQEGNGKVLLIATAQEALKDLVPRLSSDQGILTYLHDRFPVRLQLVPSEVPEVVAQRLLAKKPEANALLRKVYQEHQGALRSALALRDASWQEDDFLQQYPCHPYAIQLMQDIQSGMRGSIEEQRRLSRSERSMLKLVQAVLTGEGGITRGADQSIGWLVSLDLFYDALRADLEVISSEQVRVMDEISQLGEADGMPVARVAKALFLLQQVAQRIPCIPENIASALVDHVDVDLHHLVEQVKKALDILKQHGWVVEEEGQFRLLTPTEHDLEREVRQNYPTPAQIQQKAEELTKNLLKQFRYEHGKIRRQINVSIGVDDDEPDSQAHLRVHLFTPFSGKDDKAVLPASVSELNTLFWLAQDVAGLRQDLERAIAVEKTLADWRTRSHTGQQAEHMARLQQENEQSFSVRLPDLLRKAFLEGKMFRAGKELPLPKANSVEEALRGPLAEIAQERFTEFVDDRPDKDEDCAAILTWRPGSALPAFFTQRSLVVQNQINQSQGELSQVQAELERRKNLGLDCTGKALLDHFADPPFGWDGRLVRALAAVLFKAGLIAVRYQGRPLTDPSDAQARSLFSQPREFQKAVLEILPPVDWRQASELCSTLFGVQGGDTFERTAETVQKQAQDWQNTAGQLATRCRDNELPHHFAEHCQKASDILGHIAGISDPNARLRRFLDEAEQLKSSMSLLKQLQKFSFEDYRQARSFVHSAGDWAASLAGQDRQQWDELIKGLSADDLPSRWSSLQGELARFRIRYREAYSQRHQEFHARLQQALTDLRKHEAFTHNPAGAEAVLQKLAQWACSNESPAITDASPSCRLSYSSLEPTLVHSKKADLERQLDALIPPPPAEQLPEPLSREATIASEEEVERLTDELRRYVRRAGKPVHIQINARVKEQ